LEIKHTNSCIESPLVRRPPSVVNFAENRRFSEQPNFTVGAKIPIPKFAPTTDLAVQFLEDLEQYMIQKRLVKSDWITQLYLVFAKEKIQELWRKRTRVIISNWSEFREHFCQMFGSSIEDNPALKNLVLRRQLSSESFESFA